MKFNLKMIAVAAAMVSAAGAANAALATGANSSLALLAFNTTNGNYYIRDTGYLLNSFLPSSVTTLSGDGGVSGDKTPAAGLTLNTTTNPTSFADASFSTWYAGQGATDVARNSNIRWVVSAFDNTSNATTSRKRLISSSADNAGLTVINEQIDNYLQPGNAGGLATLFDVATLSATGNLADYTPFSTNFGLGEGSLASLGSSAGLFYAVRSTNSGSTQNSAVVTRYENATGYATVTLAANGDFTYALAGAGAPPVPPSAVPVPAAAWLFGSGLLSFGAFVRRRTAK
jgi:hypothetical protein